MARSIVTPMLWGAVIGAIATMTVGFTFGGWMFASKAEAMAESRATAAVVTALTPLCVEKFQRANNTADQKSLLKDADPWKRHQLVEEAGWAQFPGNSSPPRGLASACADEILK